LIKDEIEYLKKLDFAFFKKPAVNLTELSSEQLVYLKRKTEKELRIRYIIKHPFWAAKRLLFHFMYYGIKTSIRKLKLSILHK